jgi:hypothetical protein
MSPSANDFQKRINREFQPGDILIDNYPTRDIRYPNPTYYEVVRPHDIGKKKILGGLLGTQEKDCIVLAKLSEHGRLDGEIFISRDGDRWQGMIRVENRTDIPSRKERG